MERAKWSSRTTFILAAVGSAVGLGNAWRFPGLVAKHGGGAFLVVYLIAMIVIGIPLLMMEIAIGRKLKSGAPGSLRGINKKAEFIGWAATSNAFIIVCYYAVVFAWVIAMVFASVKFIDMVDDTTSASNVFFDMTKSTGDVTGYSIPWVMILSLLIAWAMIYYCIRNGAHSVSKVVKYTVFIPVILLLIMAAKGLTMPGAMDGMKKLFIPDVSAFYDVDVWIDAVGQVFYSMSVMMAIMFAYGSFLDESSNVAVDSVIIAFSDMAVSIISGIVMFSTMGGVGMLDNITDSGIKTAFVVYPQAIVRLTNNGIINMIFGMIFYLMLVTLAIDSAFSIVEGVSTAISDKFGSKPKTTTKIICVIAGILSLIFITRAGLAWLDIVDNWTNQYNMILIGILECIAVGWMFNSDKVLIQINKNTKRYNVPKWWFIASIKYISPVVLSVLFIWNIVTLFIKKGGKYGYPIWAEILGGWLITLLVFLSGFIIKYIAKRNKIKEKNISWDETDIKFIK